MHLLKKITNILNLLSLVAALMLMFSTCRPAIGTPRYPRSAESFSTNFVITSIHVKGKEVVPVLAAPPIDEEDKIKKFSEAKLYMVNVPSEIKEITEADITVNAVDSLYHKNVVPLTVTINGGSVPLSEGLAVPVTIKIVDDTGRYAVQEKILKITQSEPHDLKLTSLTIVDPTKELVKTDGTLQGNIIVPYTVSSISAKDITAKFTYGEHTTVIPVELEKPSINLHEGEEKELNISVKEKKGQYRAFKCTVTVTREKKPDNADPVLEPESIFILGVRYEAGKALGVPEDTERITENDIVANFKDFGGLPVTLNPNPAEFGSSSFIEVKLSISAQTGKYVGWETSIKVKKDPTALNNPQDKNGNKKYVVKVNTITEKQSPFDFYKENYAGFSASKFDNWVLVMPSMSGIISTYKFQEGQWSGNPDSIANIPNSIGSGFEAISNVKIYRYKSRTERWSAHDGYIPAPDPYDSRFYFYRFTADAALNIKPDSSLFCVDRYSKFLFYYSDPAVIKWISGSALPKEWTDYAAPSKDDHHQFKEPFYMSDPVGYVNEDGSVVIYSWLKDNINSAQYHAQKNSAYTKKAGRSPSQAGYSPYRDKIIIKRNEVETTLNSAYTVAVPVILGQPKAVRIKPNAAEEVAFTVKTAPAPKGEELSYQWYETEGQSNEGGAAISGATSSVYTPDKSAEKNCYVYCVVTNTNKSNGKTETVASRAVKLLIHEGSLAVDAEQPIIIEKPQDTNVWINTTNEIKLTVKAASPDKGNITYQWYKNLTKSNEGGNPIPGETQGSYTVTIDRTDAKEEYYYCKISNTNTNQNIVDGNPVATISTEVVTVKVEEGWPLVFSVKNDEGGKIIALRNQQRIDVNTYVKRGDKISFLAFPDPNYEAQPWEGPTVTANPNLAERTITCKEDAETNICTLAYIPPGKLTVTPAKLKNLTFNNHSQGDDGYFVHDFRISSYYDTSKSDDFVTVWEKYKGKRITRETKMWHDLNPSFQIAHYIKENQHVTNNKGFVVKYEYVKLDTELIHYHGKYKIDTYYYPTSEQILSDYRQSAIEFKYDRSSNTWKCNTKNNVTIPNVTVTYDKNFVLARGKTKDFVIKYTYAGKGAAEVTYTLKWE